MADPLDPNKKADDDKNRLVQAAPVTAAQPKAPVLGQAARPSTPQRRVGTGFTNIQRVLGANVGSRLGGAVGRGVQQAGEQAGTRIRTAGQEFQQQLGAADIGTPEKRQRIQSILDRVSQGGAAPTQSEIAEFGTALTGKYAGPMGLGDTSAATSARSAYEMGRSLGTSGGRQELLQRFAATPGRTYSLGQRAMDLAILGQQAGQQPFREARQATLGLSGQYETAQAAAQAQAAEAAARARAISEFTKSETQARVNPELEKIKTQLSSTQEKIKPLLDYYKDIPLSQLTSEELTKLGLERFIGKPTYGVTVGEMVKPREVEVTDIADKATAAKLKALGQLSGAEKLVSTYAEPEKFSGGKDLVKSILTSPEEATTATVGRRREEYEKANFAVGAANKDINDYLSANVGFLFGGTGIDPKTIMSLPTSQKVQYLQTLSNQVGSGGATAQADKLAELARNLAESYNYFQNYGGVAGGISGATPRGNIENAPKFF